MEPKTTKHMRWHKDGRRANPSVMVHPSDAEARTHFNTVCPDFAMDARNVRVAMVQMASTHLALEKPNILAGLFL